MVRFYGVRPSKVAHRQRFGQGVIRAKFTLGDSICGIIQQAVQRFVPECRDVRLCARNQAVVKSLPDAVEHLRTVFVTLESLASGYSTEVQNGLRTHQLADNLNQS